MPVIKLTGTFMDTVHLVNRRNPLIIKLYTFAQLNHSYLQETCGATAWRHMLF